jgi:hypothetical protein
MNSPKSAKVQCWVLFIDLLNNDRRIIKIYNFTFFTGLILTQSLQTASSVFDSHRFKYGIT